MLLQPMANPVLMDDSDTEVDSDTSVESDMDSDSSVGSDFDVDEFLAAEMADLAEYSQELHDETRCDNG